MNKKLIFRILGAISCSLIIIAVFVPFVSIYGFSQNLWETYKAIDTMYLPIMIIVFGVIGVLFFSLNIKTEFAYMSAGAILFFVITQTGEAINSDTFNTLSIGYYFLIIGSILSGIMAFLCNLKPSKKSQPISIQETNNTPSMLEQVDKLYNDQVQEIQPIQPIDTIVQPLTVEEINPVPIQTLEPVNSVQTQSFNQPISPVNNVQNEQPIIEPLKMENNQVTVQTTQEPQNIVQPLQVNQSANANVQKPVNPVVQQFNQPTPSVNPVVNEFTNSNFNNPAVNNPVNQFGSSIPTPQQPTNPVLQQFQTGLNINNNGLETDIFGQPINK